MKKTIVTIDFSNNSKAKIHFAIQLACHTPCKLIFYNVNTLSAVDALPVFIKYSRIDQQANSTV